MNTGTKIKLRKKAISDLEKIPKNIVNKFFSWVFAVEEDGIRMTRKISSLHDEPLKGNRFGQRSVRLNRAYRVIYIELSDGEMEIIDVLEVNKHDY